MRSDGFVTIGIDLETKKFDAQIEDVQKQLEDLISDYKDMAKQKGFRENRQEAIDMRKQIEKLNNKLVELKKRQDDVGGMDLSKLGKGLKGAITSVKRWALALFGIRSAYMGIRTAINQVSQSNQDVANTISYAKAMMSTALEPIIIRIVDWLKTALAYINQLFKAWFKRDLFGETNKNLKQANKQARDLKKTLAGFDEMNILNSSSSGGGGGISSSDLNLPSVEETGIFGWILNNRDKVLEILAMITTALVALRITGFNPLVAIFSAILTSGIYTFISGILAMIQSPSWENFGVILEGLGVSIASIAAILLSLGVVAGPTGWLILGIGALIGLLGGVTVELTKNRDGIKSVEQATNDLNDARTALADKTANWTRAMANETEAMKKYTKAIKGTNLSGEELFKTVGQDAEAYSKLTPKQKEVYDAYVELVSAQGRAEVAHKAVIEAKKNEIKENLEIELSNSRATNSYETLKNKVIEAYNEEMITAGEASDFISRAMAQMDYDTMKTFSKDIPASIISGLDPYQYKTKMEKLKAWWSGELAKFDKEIKLKVSVQSKQIKVDTAIIGHKSIGFAKGGIYAPKLPRLASGAIASMPGRGIPTPSGGANWAEAGREGYLPLTNSQIMSTLGQEIGKNVNIVATVPVYVGNRMIAKEMKRINAEDDFAYNR